MLYKVIHDKSVDAIVVLEVRRDAMKSKGAFITDGNAASSPTTIIPSYQAQKSYWSEITDNVQKEWWNEEDGSKRKIMAECLVPERIAPEYVQTVYTANLSVREKLEGILGFDIPIVPEANMFFQPTRKIRLQDKLYLVKGDMFFSRQQTLTISVNCVGVMGKGLASRAKYQFPGVYVYYEDLCKQKKMRLGKPHLYKQELSLDYKLADVPETLQNGVMETWGQATHKFNFDRLLVSNLSVSLFSSFDRL
jgi:hypothetical protein